MTTKSVSTHFEHVDKKDPDCMICNGAVEAIHTSLDLKFAVEMGMEDELVLS